MNVSPTLCACSWDVCAAPQMETPSVVSPQVLSRLFLQQTLLFIDFFLFICVKIHTRSACSSMLVQKSFMSLKVGRVPQMLKLKPNLCIWEHNMWRMIVVKAMEVFNQRWKWRINEHHETLYLVKNIFLLEDNVLLSTKCSYFCLLLCCRLEKD